MMKTTLFRKMLMIGALCVWCLALSRPAYASDSSWWDRFREFGSEAAETVEEHGPGIVESVKQKGRELLGSAKEAAANARDRFVNWNARQEEEFWNRTEEMLGSSSTTVEPAEITSPDDTPREALAIAPSDPADGDSAPTTANTVIIDNSTHIYNYYDDVDTTHKADEEGAQKNEDNTLATLVFGVFAFCALGVMEIVRCHANNYS